MSKGMKLIGKIRKSLGVSTNYKLAKLLNKHGVDITPNGVTQYEQSARGMRLEVLCALREISGWSWDRIGQELDDEFLTKRKL
jgi:hypothetical protein